MVTLIPVEHQSSKYTVRISPCGEEEEEGQGERGQRVGNGSDIEEQKRGQRKQEERNREIV